MVIQTVVNNLIVGHGLWVHQRHQTCHDYATNFQPEIVKMMHSNKRSNRSGALTDKWLPSQIPGSEPINNTANS